MVAECPSGVYRSRNPRTTPLYRLVEAYFDEVKGQWEERFERGHGFWRGFVDEQIRRYLDCGLFENGFARIRCPDCHAEYLLAFSCKTRDLCPSCAAKRSVATAAMLAEDVLSDVGHAQWVLVMPKMLRPYFLHHRELLGGLARAAWETARELMSAAVAGDEIRPGMVIVVQTAGDLGNWHPHVHAVVSRGGWTRDWRWVGVPFIDEHAAELIFRHKVIRLLQGEGLLSDERTELLLSWRHTGFSVHTGVRVEPEEKGSLERLARYILRPPFSLERMRWGGEGKIRYRRKGGHEGCAYDAAGQVEEIEPDELLARVIMHIPEPRRHLVRYYGAYSNVSRGKRRRFFEGGAHDQVEHAVGDGCDVGNSVPRSVRRRWAQLIKRVYEVDPLVCTKCGAEMQIVAFILDHKVVQRILRHLETKAAYSERGPPEPAALDRVASG